MHIFAYIYVYACIMHIIRIHESKSYKCMHTRHTNACIHIIYTQHTFAVRDGAFHHAPGGDRVRHGTPTHVAHASHRISVHGCVRTHVEHHRVHVPCTVQFVVQRHQCMGFFHRAWAAREHERKAVCGIRLDLASQPMDHRLRARQLARAPSLQFITIRKRLRVCMMCVLHKSVCVFESKISSIYACVCKLMHLLTVMQYTWALTVPSSTVKVCSGRCELISCSITLLVSR